MDTKNRVQAIRDLLEVYPDNGDKARAWYAKTAHTRDELRRALKRKARDDRKIRIEGLLRK